VLAGICGETALKTKRFAVSINCVSLMCRDRPFLYVRWNVVEGLVDLRRELQGRLRDHESISYKDEVWDNEEWIAKTSLAGYDTEYCEAMLDMIIMAKNRLGSDLNTEFAALSLIKYGSGNEKLVDSFRFAS